jgi:hypothetical protein
MSTPGISPTAREQGLPCLAAELADAARRRLSALSRAFLAPARVGDPGLAGGKVGVALAHDALERLFPGRGHARAAARLRARALVAAQPALGIGLFSGLTGIAWDRQRVVADGPDELAVILDAWLAEQLARPVNLPFELMTGLAGIGVYLLARGDRPDARRALAHLVDRLADASVLMRQGRVWPTRLEHLPDFARAQHTDGELDFGAAHGQPVVLAVLAHAAAAGVPRAATLADEGFDFLRGQALPEGAPSLLPSIVIPGVGPDDGAPRPGWCYGDVGVAACLDHGGRALGAPAWLRLARAAARRAARRPVGEAVLDAGLCHGAAGIGHGLHRLARATGDDEVADAARRWLALALAQARPDGQGVAGYLARVPGPRRRPIWAARRTYLEGAAGVVLALATAVDPAAAGDWDAPLALSPPRSAP